MMFASAPSLVKTEIPKLVLVIMDAGIESRIKFRIHIFLLKINEFVVAHQVFLVAGLEYFIILFDDVEYDFCVRMWGNFVLFSFLLVEDISTAVITKGFV